MSYAIAMAAAAGQARNPDRVYEIGSVGTSGKGVDVTSGAATNGLSAAWTDLHTFGADCSEFILDCGIGGNARFMLDLALNGTILVQNLPFQARSLTPVTIPLPFKANAADVLQAKLRCSVASTVLNIATSAGRKNSTDAPGFTSAVVRNVDTGNTRAGTPNVAAATTPPAWTEIVAVADAIPASGAFMLSPSEATTIGATEYMDVRVGIDVGGVVTEIGRKLMRVDTANLCPANLSALFKTAIPANSKLVMKAIAQTTGGYNMRCAVILFQA